MRKRLTLSMENVKDVSKLLMTALASKMILSNSKMIQTRDCY